MINKIRILIIIATAVIFTWWITPKIFLANSPHLNPKFIAGVRKLPASMTQTINNYFAKKETSKGTVVAVSQDEARATLNSLKKVTPPAGALFKTITTNVSAAETGRNNEVILKIDKGAKYSVRKLMLPDGRVMKVISIGQ